MCDLDFYLRCLYRHMPNAVKPWTLVRTLNKTHANVKKSDIQDDEWDRPSALLNIDEDYGDLPQGRPIDNVVARYFVESHGVKKRVAVCQPAPSPK